MGPDLVTTRSATGLTIPDVEPELLVLTGSVVPAGGDAVAVLVIVPAADATTVPDMVKVTLAPAGSVGILPLTVLPATEIEAGQTAPPAALLHTAAAPLRVAGNVSVNVAPLAALGPAFEITTV